MGTYTTNNSLYKPTVGEQGWGSLINTNFDKIDEKITNTSINNVTINTGVVNRSPVYFNGTKWVLATTTAAGFYNSTYNSVVISGYLDGFTGLTTGNIYYNRGIAVSTTAMVIMGLVITNTGVAQIGNMTGTLTGDVTGDVTGTLTGNVNGFLLRNFTFGGSTPWIVAGSNTSMNSDTITINYATTKLKSSLNTGSITLGRTGYWNNDDWIVGFCNITVYDINGTIVLSDSCPYPNPGYTSTKVITLPIGTHRIQISASYGSWSAVNITVSNS